MSQDKVAETTKLTSSDAPTYAKLGGEHQSLDMEANNEEYITFDFMVSLSSDNLSTNNNLQLAIKQSVDCELNQIKNLIINEIDNGNKKECRVSGKVYTDDWELTMLQKKFQKIISDRVLSGNLQTICNLNDRPTIRRFYCKTSKQLNPTTNSLAKAHETPSFRTAKDDSIKTADPTKNIPKTKAKAKVNESVSIEQQYSEHKNNDNDNCESPKENTTLKNNKRKKEVSNTNAQKSNKNEGNCDCFCVIL